MTQDHAGPSALPTLHGMPDKQLPALPAHPEQRVFERARQQTGPVSDLSERTYASTSAGGPGDAATTWPHTSTYLGSSFALAPLASFSSVSSFSEQATAPLDERTMPLSSTPTQRVSQSRTSDAPTLSVALPSPYLLLASSQTSSELGVEHALPPESHTQIPSVSANVSHTEVPVREQATLDASLPVEPPGLSQETACVEPPNMDITPPIPEDWAAGLVQPCLMIEYCDRCRWQHRATWIQTELLITFSAKQTEQPSAASGGGFLASTMLVPRVAPETAGRFRVWLAAPDASGLSQMHLLWDRKIEGGFPELKELHLGHSEKT